MITRTIVETMMYIVKISFSYFHNIISYGNYFPSSIFGTYKSDSPILTSSPPGVETMLDTYPVFYEFVINLAKNAKIDKDILGILFDTVAMRRDLAEIVKDIATSTDPVKIEMGNDLRRLPTYDVGPAPFLSFKYVLVDVLWVG